MHGPSADAEEPMAEPYWATCPARARMRKCTVFCLHSVNTQGVAAAFQRHAQARGFCLQGFPFECFDQLGPSLAGSAKQLQAEEAPHKTLVMRILALELQF